ncbi:hypothetical protein MNEG_8159 [Monoraphidium neglectum]|uniref:FAD-binding domain-containing protein n=1 Tax=Monoraphidium neglectum TaxID=145388 RepID=A0A0D2MGE1_9CHLO|nr:hypothetical protein MNEG_8159 [Monoraphidium neglectum]KIY99801.1 hypothetical protein MNEG_8159 [Monoraphidium neglectum]|eukprot:XP_013898821.1 hypothetical protein MNEG_8159 [Monoraphidium neglectum]
MQRVLAESLTDGAVQYGKRFAGLAMEPGPGGASLLTFEDGDSVAARVVVGADGLLSRVREAWLGDGGPAFDSRVIFRGMAATKDVERLPGWADVDARIIPTGADAMNMVYKVDSRLGCPATNTPNPLAAPPQLHGGMTVWAVNMSYDAAKECGVSYSPYAKGAASRASLMEPEAAGAACMAEAKKLWDRLPPAVQQVSGVGANLAFEDAAVLAHHLAAVGPCEAALRAYEADRLPRLKAIAEFNIDLMNKITKAAGEEYLQLKERQTEFERTVMFKFDHPCTRGGSSTRVGTALAM